MISNLDQVFGLLKFLETVGAIGLAPSDKETLTKACDDIRTVERNADVLLNACKDIGLALNTRKTKYMDPRGMRMGSGEGSTMRNFIVCTVHLI